MIEMRERIAKKIIWEKVIEIVKVVSKKKEKRGTE